MAKSEKQKLKLIYILDILSKETNEKNPMPMKQLLARLQENEIKAERKSIYSDIGYLREFGYQIEYDPSRKCGGYYMADREFELPELKILVDMVEASRFLSEKKSRELIGKITKLACEKDAGELRRSIRLSGRAKTRNEDVYTNVDKIHQAINRNRGITFQYQQMDYGREPTYRKSGSLYRVSPYHLVWNNENYYLIGFDEKAAGDVRVRTYRVDRMKNITVSETERTGRECFQDFDITKYSNSVFNMFGGEKRKVRLVCDNKIASVVMDHFGDGVNMRRRDEGHFSVLTEIITSPQFFGWVAGLGDRIQIEAPEDVRKEFLDYLEGILESYRK